MGNTWLSPDLGSLVTTCEAQSGTIGVDITCGPTTAPVSSVRPRAQAA